MTLAGDNGLLNRTTKAKQKTEEAGIMENIKLAYQNALIGNYVGESGSLAEKIKTEIENIYGTGTVEEITEENGVYTVKITGYGTYSIDANGNVSKKAGVNLSKTNIELKIKTTGETTTYGKEEVDVEIVGLEGNISFEPSTSSIVKITPKTADNKKFEIEAKSEGNETIKVRCGEEVAECTVTVTREVSVTEISSITPTSATMVKGNSTQQTITATVNEGATEKLVWTSNPSGYITISEPIINTTNNTQTVTLTLTENAQSGNVTITAQSESGLNANNTSTITINVPVTGIILKKVENETETSLSETDRVAIAPSGSKTFKAIVQPEGASTQGINWSVSPSGVAGFSSQATTTSDSGDTVTLSAIASTGTATLKAESAESGSIYATCQISVGLNFTTVTAPNATNATTCVGCYASIDGDNVPDGIIYADLGKGNQNTTGLGVSYSFSALTGTDATNLKTYVISDGTVEGSMGPRKLIKLAGNNEGTVKRFYIMGLTDIKDSSNNSTLYWYYNAYNQSTYTGKMTDYNSANGGSPTSINFGTGAANTTTMKSKYSQKSYGNQNSGDIWYQTIPTGWYVPSKLEWAAFAGELGVTKDNYGTGTNKFGLNYLRLLVFFAAQREPRMGH